MKASKMENGIQEAIKDFFSWESATYYREIMMDCLTFAVSTNELEEHEGARSNYSFLINQVCTLIDKAENVRLKTLTESEFYEFLEDFFSWDSASGHRENLMECLTFCIGDQELNGENKMIADYCFSVKMVSELVYKLETMHNLKAA